MRSEGRSFLEGLGIVLAVAVILRGFLLLSSHSDPIYWNLFLLDSELYKETAERILSGDWIAGNEAYALGPLYPYLLAVLQKTFGPGYGPAYVFQQLLGLGSIAMTALIARRCFDPRTAIAAAGLLALYAPLAMLELRLMASTLAIFLGLSAVLLLLRCREKQWSWQAVLPGVLLGLMSLARPEMMVFWVVAALWILWDGNRWRAPGRRFPASRLGAVVPLALGILITIAPATVRNFKVEGELILISSQGGVTFHQGNQPRSRGTYARIPGFSGNPGAQSRQSREIAERETGRRMTRSQVSRFWFKKGLDFLSSHPSEGLTLMARKLLYWLRSHELSSEYVLPTERKLLPVLWLLPVPFGLLIALALAGMRHTGLGDPRRMLLCLFILVNLLTILTFYFSSRYRLPAVPYVAMFAGAGLIAIIERARSWRRRAQLGAWLLPSAIVLLLSFLPLQDGYQLQAANEYYNIGNLYYEAGRYEEAARSYKVALERLDSRWQIHYNLANTYRRLERWGEAVAEYQRVLDRNPDHATARRRLQEALEKSSGIPPGG